MRDQLLDPAGALTLNADAGVTLSSDVDTLAGVLTIDADNNNDGTGTLSLQAVTAEVRIYPSRQLISPLAAIANANALSITATNNRTIGLGAVGGDLNLRYRT